MGRGREHGLNEETHLRSQCEVLYVCGEMGNGDRTLCSPELRGYGEHKGSLCVAWSGVSERAKRGAGGRWRTEGTDHVRPWERFHVSF